MRAAVSLKATLLREGATTEVTLIGLLSSVNKLVSLKVLQQRELFSALCTLVLLHTRVDQLVTL